MKRKEMRLIPLMLVLIIVISLVGCGKKNNDDLPSAGDYTYNAGQYDFSGIPGDESLTNENGSDTDSVGNAYGGGKNYGSYGSKNPGYVQPPAQGNYGGNSNNGSYNINNGKYMTTEEILNIVKGSADTFDEAMRVLNEKGIYPSEIAKKAIEAYYNVSDSVKNDYASKIQGGVSDIYGKLTEYASNRTTTAPLTDAFEAE